MRGINSPLIFIVEDEPFYLKVIENHLRAFNFNNVRSFFSGEECVNNISQKPDIVILDYKLEGQINGIDVLTRIKEEKPNTHVIFLSGKKDKKIAFNSVKLGAVDFVYKNKEALKKLLQIIKDLNAYDRLTFIKKSIRMILIIIFSALIILFITNIFFPNLFNFQY